MSAQKGFTLVELLVVISIIAILSVIGVTVFTGIQKSARDVRRKADIDAIAKALEVHYGDSSCGANSETYCIPQISWFANGSYPYDPKADGPSVAGPTGCGAGNSSDHYKNECWYCYNLSSSRNVDYCGGPDGFFKDGGWTTSSQWTVCANLENTPGYYCKKSAQ